MSSWLFGSYGLPQLEVLMGVHCEEQACVESSSHQSYMRPLNCCADMLMVVLLQAVRHSQHLLPGPLDKVQTSRRHLPGADEGKSSCHSVGVDHTRRSCCQGLAQTERLRGAGTQSTDTGTYR